MLKSTKILLHVTERPLESVDFPQVTGRRATVKQIHATKKGGKDVGQRR